jgi:hypothetical protein
MPPQKFPASLKGFVRTVGMKKFVRLPAKEPTGFSKLVGMEEHERYRRFGAFNAEVFNKLLGEGQPPSPSIFSASC